MDTPTPGPDGARTRFAAPRPGQRLVLLALCVGVGSAVGVAGRHFGGTDAWFLAVPILIAIGWFALADPGACTPDHPRASPSRQSRPNRSHR